MKLGEDHTISSRKIEPYLFSGLKKISKRALAIERALLHYLPTPENVSQRALEEFLTKQFNAPSKVYLEKIEEGQLLDWVQSLPDPCFTAILGMQPAMAKVFLWIDSVWAGILIDRVLGGEGKEPTEIKELTPIEQGVFQYILLKSLNEIYQAHDESTPFLFRLERIPRTYREFTSLIGEDSPIIKLHFRLQVGSEHGFIMLVLPHPFIEATLLNPELQGKSEEFEEKEFSEKSLESVAYIRAPLWSEVGSVSLTISEKNQLEKGDVILFDETHCQQIGDHLTGNIILRVGDGKEGGFLAQIISSESPVILKIIDYYGG